MVPYTWVMDPAPLPPHAAIPELNLTDWRELKTLSQKERELILKVSGFSEQAWGSRGVSLGSDLPQADWSTAVKAGGPAGFDQTPYVLQRYDKPRVVEVQWVDLDRGTCCSRCEAALGCVRITSSPAKRALRAHLGGVLATICPADKKIIHGMAEAIFGALRRVAAGLPACRRAGLPARRKNLPAAGRP